MGRGDSICRLCQRSEATPQISSWSLRGTRLRCSLVYLSWIVRGESQMLNNRLKVFTLLTREGKEKKAKQSKAKDHRQRNSEDRKASDRQREAESNVDQQGSALCTFSYRKLRITGEKHTHAEVAWSSPSIETCCQSSSTLMRDLRGSERKLVPEPTSKVNTLGSRCIQIGWLQAYLHHHIQPQQYPSAILVRTILTHGESIDSEC